MEDNEVLLATDFDCFSELADIIGAERAVLELNRIIESGIDVYLSKDLVEAFEWSDSPQGDHFWGGIKAMGLAGKKWQEGEERMNNIAQNGSDGEHYGEIVKQKRYKKESGMDKIDEWARDKTHDQFRTIMWAMCEKYESRLGKKDAIVKEVGKMADYMHRWSLYEQQWAGEE